MKNADRLSVLIVDDDDMMRAYLRLMLRQAGVERIDEAGTAEKTLKVVTHRPPDVVFLDINLPDRDGIDLLESIKSDRPGCQVIMVSGEATKDRVDKAIDKGAADFIAKPFNASVVESKVKKVVSSFQ
jgi:DNA-binding NtrC family response regulator